MPRRPPRSAHQLRVTLLETDPSIWRRLQVSSTINLRRLHAVLQVAFGWTQSHLYEFEIGGVTYGEPSPEWEWQVNRAKATQLRRVAADPGTSFTYLYDFGDGWKHELVLEGVMPPVPGVTYLRCIDGARSGSPEDVGGVWGYADFLVAIANPTHPEHDDLISWSGGHFDPEACDLASMLRHEGETTGKGGGESGWNGKRGKQAEGD